MLKFSPIRAAFIAVVAIVSVLLTIPSFLPKDSLAAYPDWLPKQTMVLGLDLQGGSHLLLAVNRDSILAERIKDLRRDARTVLASDNGIGNIITTNPRFDQHRVDRSKPARRRNGGAAGAPEHCLQHFARGRWG